MDEFIIDGFRVMMTGNRLELSFEAPGTSSSDAAKALADEQLSRVVD